MPRTIHYCLLLLLFSFIYYSCSKDSDNPQKDDVDTTAPTLNFSITGVDTSLNEPIILSENIEINIEATDKSGINKVEAFINNEKVGEDTSEPFNLNIDISVYASKSGKNNSDLNTTLKIVATDKAGNKATLEKNIIIITRTLLLDINIPDGFINSFFENIYVFASDMDGNYLDSTTEPITSSTRKIKIFAPENFDLTKEFMITFMTFNPGSERSFSYASTFQNLTMDNPKEINLKVPERFSVIEDKFLPAVGFGNNIFPTGDGVDYRTSLNASEEEWLFETLRSETTNDRTTDKIYLSYILNWDPTNYHYLFIDRPLPEDFQLDASSFENSNSVTGSISFSNLQQAPRPNASLKIYGYESETDFQNNIFHTLWDIGIGNFSFPIGYSYYDSFHQYRYALTIENFRTTGLGLPLEEYTIPNWTVNPIIQNNRVILNKTGEGHSIGRVSLHEDQENDIYDWRILFDSESVDEVVIPQIPEQFQNVPLFTLYGANSFKLQQTEISKFEGITNFGHYLTDIIKENRNIDIYSNKKETIFHSDPEAYFQFNDFIFD
jgi:Big-like domain-containing protein